MKYIAVQTAGRTKDYAWQCSGSPNAETHLALETLIDNAPSIVISHHDQTWNFYIGGIQTESIDYRGRINRLSIAFLGINQAEARSLAAFALKNWDFFSRKLCASIRWEIGKADVEWHVDFSTLEKIPYFATAQISLTRDALPLTGRRERDNTPENLVELADELEKYSFSPEDGVKLVVTGAPSNQAYNRMLDEADRALWSGATERDLKIKPPHPSPSPSPKSKEPSMIPSGTYQPQSPQPSESFQSWISSNKEFLVTCGVTILLLLVLSSTSQCGKKKDVEPRPPVLNPVPPENPTVKGKTTNTSGDQTPKAEKAAED